MTKNFKSGIIKVQKTREVQKMKYLVDKMVNAMYVQVRDEEDNVITQSVNTIDKAKARELFCDLCEELLDYGMQGESVKVYAILNDEETEFEHLFTIEKKIDFPDDEVSLVFKN